MWKYTWKQNILEKNICDPHPNTFRFANYWRALLFTTHIIIQYTHINIRANTTHKIYITENPVHKFRGYPVFFVEFLFNLKFQCACRLEGQITVGLLYRCRSPFTIDVFCLSFVFTNTSRKIFSNTEMRLKHGFPLLYIWLSPTSLVRLNSGSPNFTLSECFTDVNFYPIFKPPLPWA